MATRTAFLQLFAVLFFVTLLVFFAAEPCKAQNLVPNPGFEKPGKDWVQPCCEFYHWEDMYLDTNGHTQYNHMNGLCIIQPLPSEYMYVKLKKPLKAGKTYCFRFKTFFKYNSYDNPAWLKQVEFAFLDQAYPLPQRDRIFVDPDLVFLVDTLAERPCWQYHDTIFTATHGGEYLYIGRFFTEAVGKAYDEWTNIEAQLEQEKEALIQATKDTFAMRKIDIPDATSKRQLKRQTRLLHDFTALNRMRQDSAIKQIKRFYQLTLDTLKDQQLQRYYFQVRTYFDDICLSERAIDGTCNCTDTAISPSLVAGQTYSLRNIFFDLDKATLKTASEEELQQLLDVLNQYPQMQIQINGHTDNQNTSAYNLKLSTNRAKTVVTWLTQHGIQPQRLRWKGYGEAKPLADNTTETGRALNRRVEFVVLKVE